MRLSEFTHWLARRIAPWDGAEDGNVSGRWTGLTAEARAPLVAALCTAGSKPRKVLVVTSSYDKALQWQARLGLCGVPADQVKVLPNGQSSLYEDSSPETVALSERIGALRFLVSDGPGFVIGSAQAVLERTLPREDLSASFVQIKPGETWDLDSTCKLLERLGHELGEPVRVPGQYSRRGGILDVFPMGSERPLRVELFGDEVETVREFDPMTQRSQGSAAGLEVGPSRETLLPEQAAQVAEMIGHALNIEADRMSDDYSRRLRELVEGDIRSLLKGSYFDRLDLYRPLLHPDSGCAVDLVPEGGTVVLDEPDELEAVAAKSESELQDALQHRHNRGEILHSTTNDFLLPPEHLGSHSRTLSLSMGDGPNWLPSSKSTAIGAASLAGYRGQPTLLTKSLKDWLEQGFIIGLSTEQPLRAKSMLSQVDLFTVEEGFEDAKGGEVFLLEGNLAGGFVVPDSKLALVTDQELFGVARLRLAQRKFSEGIPVTTILDLQPGDFVVHINFGIGIYRGLTSRVTDGVEKEFLQIDYQVPDRLFVPADQLDRIQKYLAPEDSPPKINRLTGSEWKKTVSKAREEAREFARGLIALYAERKKVSRKSYGPDTPWQSEMEHTFPWVETPSQLAAIQDVKTDLKTDFPMDRLVCGDVGFGKTEVAIRATFKVVQEGKQVAILCPTTILSEQHYRNFVERLAGFPTRLDILNRFRTAAEKTDVKKKLESGEVDVLIGTHALLNKELKFKNLGLLVIDEEQKFGVKHKEALKSLKVSVDVLTLSATPIPRTLSMALMNIRQMSLINDPPPGRLPVRTI
ncbi:MAG: DEAD/DEAH box helicase, partial [Chthonomonadaceae bacterium]|nr:DEAD/DEAH box helicase [Chthonomonadaceae bacterium]